MNCLLLYSSFFLLFFTHNIFIVSDSSNIFYNKSVELYTNNNLNGSKNLLVKLLENHNLKKDTILTSKIFFLLGNIYFKENNFLFAINYYENAIRNNAKYDDAKYNLVLARKKLYELNREQNNSLNNEKKNDTSQTDNKLPSEKIKQILNEAIQLEKNAMKKAQDNNSQKFENIKNW